VNILWFANVALPEASNLMAERPSPYGGWMIGAANMLAKEQDVHLSIAFPHRGEKDYQKYKGLKITYYPFKEVSDRRAATGTNVGYIEELIADAKPDIVHVFGSEMAHSLVVLRFCRSRNLKAVLSIQGLVSVCALHMFSGLPCRVIYGNTLRNILRRDSVNGLRHRDVVRGRNERRTIQYADNIIGRTVWDKACTEQINGHAKYYKCNETLRDEFYNHIWNIDGCEKHSIFVSQAHYPIKGLHFLLEALPLVLNEFPDTKVYVAGKDITKTDSIRDKLLVTYYGRYLRELIKKERLDQKIKFVGELGEIEMSKRYLKSNVFVSASTIENESNSVSEARLLGVPCVISYAGGVSDRIEHGVDGYLYQHDAPYMLAYYICQIFRDPGIALKFSREGRKKAMEINDRASNHKVLMSIYRQISIQ